MFELSKSELCDLRSKLLTTNVSSMNRKPTKVFTERGLYMLATIIDILEVAEETTKHIWPITVTTDRYGGGFCKV